MSLTSVLFLILYITYKNEK